MIEPLKPYPEYKPCILSGQDVTPAHWTTRRIKTVLSENDSRSRNGVGTLLALTRLRGLVPRQETTDKTHSARTLVGYKCYTAGQIVMNRMQAWSGMFGISTINGLVSPDYATFDVRHGQSASFILYRIKAPDLVGEFALRSKGIGSGFNRLYSDSFGSISVSLPPPEEQAAIVRYLNQTSAQIERAIRAKKKLIALLNEQMEVTISSAMKANVGKRPDKSGTWESWPIGRFANVGNGSTPSRGNPSYWTGGTYPWLNSSQVNRGFINSADQFVTTTALQLCHLPKVPAGSVLVAITGQGKTRGKSAVLGFEATINQHIAYITLRLPICSPEFMRLALTSAYSELRALSDDSGSTKGAITCENLKHFRIPIPSLEEQQRLLTRARVELGRIEKETSAAERQIALLSEYRTRLTADVVTGKLDVRQAAAQFPDITDDLPEPTSPEDEDPTEDESELEPTS